MRRLLLFVLLLAAGPAFAQQAARPLTLGQAVADSLAAAPHAFTLDLAAGRFVAGHVDQQTVDVVVTVHAPDGTLLATFDGPARGPEPFQFETAQAGVHRLEVAPFEGAQGRYTLRLVRAEPVATEPEARVDQLMTAYSAPGTPGGVVAVVQGGRLRFAKGYGLANLTHEIPFTAETRSNIGSVSKQFTAFAVALLAQEGKLSLDDDVRKHLPELKDFGQTVTLRHLLTHTSGYREFLNALALTGRRLDEGDYVDRAEIVALVQRQPALQNAPGAEWNYNNTGYGLLAAVVERVSGQPFDAWMAEHVFGPLGMRHTLVRASPSQVVPHSAQGYLPGEDGFREAADLGGAVGAGGIYTTAADLARWMGNLKTGAVGGPDVIRQMTTPFVLTTGDTTGYGLGLFIDTFRGLARWQHGGADTAHRALLMYFPTLDAGVVTMSNNGSFDGGIAGAVAAAFFGDHLAPAAAEAAPAPGASFDPATYDPAAFDAFVGRYALDVAPNFILSFTREGDRLYTQATGQPRLEIVPTSDSTFALQAVQASLTFHRAPDGAVRALTLHQNGNHRAHRLDEAPPPPLDAFAGRYFSEEIETFYTLAVEEGKLVVRHRRLAEPLALTHSRGDTFTGPFPLAEVTFAREAAGQVTGFTVSNVRTRGVHFERVR